MGKCSLFLNEFFFINFLFFFFQCNQQCLLRTFSRRSLLLVNEGCYGHFFHPSSTTVKHDLNVAVYCFLSFMFLIIIYFDKLRIDTKWQLQCVINNNDCETMHMWWWMCRQNHLNLDASRWKMKFIWKRCKEKSRN